MRQRASQPAQHQGPETEAATWNSAIMALITSYCALALLQVVDRTLDTGAIKWNTPTVGEERSKQPDELKTPAQGQERVSNGRLGDNLKFFLQKPILEIYFSTSLVSTLRVTTLQVKSSHN